MQVEIFALCDTAFLSGGKLNIMGAFDTFRGDSFPCLHALCSVVFKVRFERGEDGDYAFEVDFSDADNRPVIKPMVQKAAIQLQNGRSHTHMHTWTISNCELPAPGEYGLVLKVNGKTLSSLPVYAIRSQKE